MPRTEPIRVRSAVAQALRELTKGDETRISDVASTLLILSLFNRGKGYYNQLSPETQAALSAEVVDLLGVVFKKLAIEMRETGLTPEQIDEKYRKQMAEK